MLSRSIALVLEILFGHLVSDVIRLPDGKCDNRQRRISRRAGCELAAV